MYLRTDPFFNKTSFQPFKNTGNKDITLASFNVGYIPSACIKTPRWSEGLNPSGKGGGEGGGGAAHPDPQLRGRPSL